MARNRSLDLSKEAMTASRHERTAQHEFFEAEEGFLYGPGIAD